MNISSTLPFAIRRGYADCSFSTIAFLTNSCQFSWLLISISREGGTLKFNCAVQDSFLSVLKV